MRRRLRRAAVLLVALGLSSVAVVTASPDGHGRHLSTTDSTDRTTDTTLPCVDVTVHVTQPPPGVRLCPL